MLNSKKILIVDDEEGLLALLRQALEERGYEVATAVNAIDAGIEISGNLPSLILMDIKMPKMDGMTVAKNLKEKGIQAKIIFLTNLKDAEHITEAMDIVKDTEYIVKSDMRVDDIISLIKE